MIKKTNKKTKIEGCVPDVMTDLTLIVKGLDEAFQEAGMTKEEAKESIQHAVDLAFKSDEEIFKETINDVLKMFFGSDDDSEKYRVWCETNEIRDKVLVALENRGVKWANGDTFESFKDVFDAPMGFIVDRGLWQTKGSDKNRFDDLEFEELKAEDLIKEVEGNE